MTDIGDKPRSQLTRNDSLGGDMAMMTVHKLFAICGLSTSALAVITAGPAFAAPPQPGSATGPTTALAMKSTDAAPTDAAPTDTAPPEIIVTGSLIKRNGYDQPTPVTVLTADELQKATPTSLADGLNRLPQLGQSVSRVFCCAVGSVGNYLNLRALGTNRTLILLDGERVVPTRENGDVDVNLLPELLVQRVDVVTGGASAAYGSDAVAGVINFVIDSKFKGLKANAQYGLSQYGDDATLRLGLAGGADFAGARGHILISVEHNGSDGIPHLSDRPLSSNGHYLIGNGSTQFPFTSVFGVRQNTATYGGVIVNGAGLPISNAGAPLAGLQFLPNGATAPFQFGTAIPSNSRFTYGGDGIVNNLAQPAGSVKADRIYARLSYDVSDALTLFARTNIGRSRNKMRVLADNRQRGTAFTIFRSNPYLPASVASAMDEAGVTSFRLGRFNREFGAVTLDYDNRTYDLSAGANGSISDNWQWRAWYSYGRTRMTGRVENNSNLGNLYAATDAVIDPGSGQIVCRVTLTNPGAFPGCVPLNLFGEGSVAQAGKDFVLGTSTQTVVNTQHLAAANVVGTLAQLPGGALSLALGTEYRRRSLKEQSNPTALNQINATGVRGIPAVLCPTPSTCRFGGFNQGNFGEADAKESVKEAYAEVVAPLLKDVFAARELELNGAYRYTDYSSSGGVSTWKLGVSYAPIRGIRFRATRSRDIRAPNLFELFAGPVNAFEPGIADPVTGQSNLIIITRTQGNPNSKPEIARTLTAGVVIEPSFVPGFSGAVDYWDVNLKGALSSTSAQGTIDACFGGNTVACSLVTRAPNTNEIQQVIIQRINLDSRHVKGIDFDFSYRHSAGAGKFAVRALFTRLISYIDTSGGVSTQEAGFYDANADTTLPKWRGNVGINYDLRNWSIYAQERYIGGYKQAPFVPGQIFADPEIKAVWYTDLTATLRVNMAGSKFELFGTVNNLFGKQPPFVANRFSAGLAYPTTSATLYDLDGRYYTTGIRAAF